MYVVKIVLPWRCRNDLEHRGREESAVSYSFREPEWPAVCECRYDEVRDEMDREDCPFHCDASDRPAEAAVYLARKMPLRNDDFDVSLRRDLASYRRHPRRLG